MLKNEIGISKLDELLADFNQGAVMDDLGRFVRDAAHRARQHRRNIGVDKRMEEAERAIRCVYNPEEIPLLDHNAVYIGLTNLKVRAFRSWMADILVNAEDKPWTLKASPVPDLPFDVEEEVLETVLDEIESETGFEGTIMSRLSELKALAETHMDRVTSTAAMRMEELVNDQMLEGGWRDTLDEFLDDLGAKPAAVLKGPVLEYATHNKWDINDGMLRTVMTPVYKVKRVDPYNLFPSPDSTSPQDGAYLVERYRMEQGDLLNSGNIKGFREAAIRAAINQYPSGHVWREQQSEEHDCAVGVDVQNIPEDASNVYDVVIYYGKINGKLLYEWGLEDLDPQQTYESEVWMVGDYVIRAIRNPYPGEKRPFYVTSFDKQAGEFWGRGLPDLLRDVQRITNATARSMVKNMAFASGPVGEYDQDRLSQEEDITELTPYRMYAVDSDSIVNNTMPAFRFHQHRMVAADLMGIYERFLRQADDISGIPAYVLGSPQAQGAGRTLGGLSLLMGNAAKGIKKIISHVDKDVIEPVVEIFVQLNLMHSDDPTIKFDTQVQARGSTGILQRELTRAQDVELLQMLTPYVQAQLIPAEGLQVVLRGVIRGLGYNADEILPDPRRGQQLQNFLGNSALPTTQQGTPPPALDGRSLPPPLAQAALEPLPSA